MITNIFSRNLKRLHRRINGSTLEYNLKPCYGRLIEIKKREAELKIKIDHQLKELSKKLAVQARKGLSLDHLLVDAYALVSVVIERVLKLNPFDTQLIGAIVIHQGKIAEMQTGEGKTLTAVFPSYLNALTGNGVHILTFNDYLARRDAKWMGPVYEFLGLKTGYIQEGMSIQDRKQAYSSDITYLTANEAGFDFLRDSLSYNSDDRVHRRFNFAIIDEADSILIDEARIPLIIAAASDDYIRDTFHMTEIARKLEKSVDFEFDEYSRNFSLTELGIRRVETLLNCGNLYEPGNIKLLTELNCAIHAEFLFGRDIDYIVRKNKIELVDEFTGRIADKRRWPDGLQAALEAKENINIQSKGTILNSITLQHFIGKYPKISGMTATAESSEEEFKEFYNLDIVVIPPNRPRIREDHPDKLFKNKEAKYKALLEEIIQVHKTKRPLLVGTGSVQESEMLSEDLRKNGINCAVLNAKNDEYEAGIVALAGKLNAVTISTNMAGRGTDIRLGGADENEKKQVKALGGLYVIGTNRHESKRIDNQLRGRAGRQGDPGSSRFFISMEDDIFIKYRLIDLLPVKMLQEDQHGEIENRIIKREIERIQRIVEGQNLEIKKTLYKYSILIEQQREITFLNRDDILLSDFLTKFYPSHCPVQFNQLLADIGRDKLLEICRFISLYFIDKTWSQYLDEIANIREGIHLRRLGHQDPLFEFHKLVIEIFDNLRIDMESSMIQKFNSIDSNKNIDISSMGLKAPSSTWTYLINDDPFENMSAINFAASIGLSVGVLLTWPLMLIFPLLKWFRKRR
jgi:preprotein translocase subunit SecA